VSHTLTRFEGGISNPTAWTYPQTEGHAKIRYLGE
jgi:hypothetical protein